MHKSYSRARLALSLNSVIALLTAGAQFKFTPSARAAAGDLLVTDSLTNPMMACATDGTVRRFARGLDNWCNRSLSFAVTGGLFPGSIKNAIPLD